MAESKTDSGKNPTMDGDIHRNKPSPERLFSAEEVARLVEIARNQLRKEKAVSSGWTEVEMKQGKKKEKSYARELVDDYRSSPEGDSMLAMC